ncbi:MAG: hypothetical protein KIS87_00905 [Phycisphaeraceae bacterium]|nr:hypothetical protein [Phycisphaeraceae bacterium]
MTGLPASVREGLGMAVERRRDHEEPAPKGDRRRPVVDRRLDPRAGGAEGVVTGLERRRGPGRRLSDFRKAAEEGEMTQEQFLFLMAIDAFKRANNTWYPSWTDVLEVVRLLGYRKTLPSELRIESAEDWQETADAPANVRPDRWAERFGQSEAA